MSRLRYRSRPERHVVAVQLKLDMTGLHYRKWGHDQVAQPNDWLVDNGGEVYTVDADTFARTYAQIRPGHFVKTTRVWAERADHAGAVATQEGHTAYAQGDWLVSNHEDGRDGYAMTPAEFDRLYEADD